MDSCSEIRENPSLIVMGYMLYLHRCDGAFTGYETSLRPHGIPLLCDGRLRGCPRRSLCHEVQYGWSDEYLAVDRMLIVETGYCNHTNIRLKLIFV